MVCVTNVRLEHRKSVLSLRHNGAGFYCVGLREFSRLGKIGIGASWRNSRLRCLLFWITVLFDTHMGVLVLVVFLLGWI